MKKLYILGLSLMGLGAINAQTYELKDFEDLSLTSGGWTTQVPVDTTNWKANSFNGDNFAKISNYNGTGKVAAEAWLISPAIDLSNSTAPMVSFETIMKFTGAPIELLVSVDYDGTSTPSTATWVDLTAQATLDTDASAWGSWTPSGEVDLSSYQSNAVYIAFKYTGTTTDGSTWEIDNILIAETGTTTGGNGPSAPVAKTIVQIQSDVDGMGNSNLKDDSVMTAGIVTAVNMFNGNQKGYYIQDGVGAWTGIYVFDTINSVQRGDSITLTAVVDEYYDATQLKGVTAFNIVSNFNDVPATLITTNAVANEMYESVLVKVENATCNTLPSSATYGEWTINDGSGDINVDDYLFSYTPTLGTAYNVTGVVGYAYSNFKMYPRDANDISVYSSTPTAINENNNTLLNVYPNPVANGLVTITVTENTNLVVFDLLGNVVLSTPLNNVTNTIDVSTLSAGNYILKVGNSASKLIIQ